MKIELDHNKIAEFCQKWYIVEFSLFGSVLRDDFGPDSDVDVLVTYHPDYRLTLQDMLASEEELSGIVGRKVELIERASVEKSPNYIRRHHILNSAQTFYVA